MLTMGTSVGERLRWSVIDCRVVESKASMGTPDVTGPPGESKPWQTEST